MSSFSDCQDCDGDCQDCAGKKANPIAVMVFSQRFFEKNRQIEEEFLETQQKQNNTQSAIRRRLAALSGEL